MTQFIFALLYALAAVLMSKFIRWTDQEDHDWPTCMIIFASVLWPFSMISYLGGLLRALYEVFIKGDY